MINLTITQEDIDEGIRNSCDSCPIALAVARYFNVRHNKVYVTNTYIGVGSLSNSKSFSHNGREFIQAFDSGLYVEPTTIVLEGLECYQINLVI